MDRIVLKANIKEIFNRYKYVLLVLGIGIFIMLLPDAETVTPVQEPSVPQQPPTRAEELEEILSEISGVGKVKVLLTESSGAQTRYQTDEDRTINGDTESIRSQTVIITDSNRREEGLISSVTAPVYLGAIIVCQGGDSAYIKLSIVEAVSNVTGISSDRITVLKMK